MTTIMAKGSQIAAARIRKGMSTRELARTAGISVTVLAGYENGTRNPSPKTASKLCHVLDHDFDQLFSIGNEGAN
jgi:Predicted transcriptional regulators